MKRRDFITFSGAGLAYAGLNSCRFIKGGDSKTGISWKKSENDLLFRKLQCDGTEFVNSTQIGLLNAKCELSNGQSIVFNPEKNSGNYSGLKAHFNHTLHQSIIGAGENLLEGVLSIKNVSNEVISFNIGFTTAAQPSRNVEGHKIYIPISATALNKDKRLRELGSADFLQECEQPVGKNNFACHYLEPMASNPNIRKTKALIMAPVVEIQNSDSAWKVALFTLSEEAYQFRTIKDDQENVGWAAERHIEALPGQEMELKCWLLVHKGEADVAWSVFHQVAHHNEFAVPQWLHDVKVHYYDFLSSAAGVNGLRGDGYEADIPHFKEFNVGLAMQHGYYPYIGDFISSERKTWKAMQSDPQGPANMSFQQMKDRIEATRKTGARAGVYMHTVLFDDASPLFPSLADSVLVDENGQKKKFSWKGPDTVNQNWWMSFASEDWAQNLLKQAEYIMDILNPDAIVYDETFVYLGYENHPDRSGPLSKYSIEFFKELRRIVHSYGDDKAVLTSDCGGSNMVMWADGDAGDHSYESLLGNPLYRKEPIRYKAAIGDKPWVPCSWHFLKMWEDQMDLARKLGTAVGVSNGWIEFNGFMGWMNKTEADF